MQTCLVQCNVFPIPETSLFFSVTHLYLEEPRALGCPFLFHLTQCAFFFQLLTYPMPPAVTNTADIEFLPFLLSALAATTTGLEITSAFLLSLPTGAKPWLLVGITCTVFQAAIIKKAFVDPKTTEQHYPKWFLFSSWGFILF